MRRTPTVAAVWVALLALAVPRAAAQPADAPAPAEAAPAAAPDVSLEAAVQQITENYTVSMHHQNEPQHQATMQMSLRFTVTTAEHRRVVEVGPLTALEAQLSNGDRLAAEGLERRASHRSWRDIFSDRNRGGEFGQSVQLPPPGPGAERISMLEGRVVVQVAALNGGHARLGPIKDVAGRPATIKDLDGSRVRIAQERERWVLTVNDTARDRLERIVCLDAQGRERRLDNGGGGRDDGGWRYYLNGALDQGDTLVLYFYAGIEEHEVPFTLVNVPLPRRPQHQPDRGLLALELQREPIADGDGQPPPNELEVRLLDRD